MVDSAFSYCSSSFMQLAKKSGLTSLCWVLAMLASIQPLLAFDCRCECGFLENRHTETPDFRTGHEAHDHSCCNHGRVNSECGDERESQSLGQYSILRFAPCDCPADCDCQLRHSNDLGALRNLAETERIGPHPIAAVTWEVPDRLLSEHALHGSFEGQSDQYAVSALSLCAALCRFLA